MDSFVKRRVLAPLALGVLAYTVALPAAFLAGGGDARKQVVDEWLYLPEQHAAPDSPAAPRTITVRMNLSDLPPRLGVSDFAFADGGVRFLITSAVPRSRSTTTTQAVPQKLLMLIDQSGSMGGFGGNDPTGKRLVATKKIIAALPGTAEVGVASFPATSSADAMEPQADYSTDRARLNAAVDALQGREGGGTPTFTALKAAIDGYEQNGARGGLTVILFTDGQAEDGYLAPHVLKEAKRLGIVVHIVAFGSGVSDWSGLESFAQATGGTLRDCDRADDLSKVALTLVPSIRRSLTDYTVTATATVPRDYRLSQMSETLVQGKPMPTVVKEVIP